MRNRPPLGSRAAYAKHMDDTECIFCAIVAGDIPADIVLENDSVIAFRDIAPKAPTHVLVVPRVHVPDVPTLAHSAPEILADVVQAAGEVAKRECDGDFQLVFNTGVGAGQTVFHVHGHVLGGAQMWQDA